MSVLRYASALLFCLALAAIAWPVGGNYPHVRTILAIFALLMGILAVASQFSKDRPQRFSFTWVLLILGCGYGLYQFFPGTGTSVLETASSERWIELAIGCLIFMSACCLLDTRRFMFWVMTTATVTGVVIGFFGICQSMTFNGKLFWSYELLDGGVPFGPFVNKNNAGGFLLACFSAAVFLFSHQLFTWFPQHKSGKKKRKSKSSAGSEMTWETAIGKSKYNFVRRFFSHVAGLQTKHLYTIVALTFLGVVIVATLSRGAMLALVVSLVVTAGFLSYSHRWVLAAVVLLCIGGTGLTLWVDQSGAIAQKVDTMGSLEEISEAGSPRLDHWQSVKGYVSENYMLGSGIGTYRFAYPEYLPEGKPFEQLFFHAENIYLETLAEMGIPGIVLLLLIIISCLVASTILYRRKSTFDKALGVSGFCLISGQMVAAFFDFGLYQPPNMMIVAVLSGMLISRATLSPDRNDTGVTKTYFGSRMLRVALVSVVLVGCTWGAYQSHAIENVKHATRLLRFFDKEQGTQEELLDRALPMLERALAIRPDDMEAHYQLGMYHVMRFRRAAMEDMIQASLIRGEASADEPKVTSTNRQATEIPEVSTYKEAWPYTSLMALHRMSRLAKRLAPDRYAEMKDSAPIAKHITQAWTSFENSENTYKQLSRTVLRKAQLSPLMDPDDLEVQYIEEALQRRPNDAKLLFDCGLMALASNRQDDACKYWQECQLLTRRYEAEIIQFGRFQLTMRQLFEQVLPQNPGALLRIAKIYFGTPEQMIPQKLLLVHAGRVMANTELSEARQFFLSGEIKRLSGDHKAAIELFIRGLDVEPAQVEWRFVLAETLFESKQYDEAIRQLKICMVESGRSGAIEKTIKKIERERSKARAAEQQVLGAT